MNDVKQRGNMFYITDECNDIVAEITFNFIKQDIINVNHTYVKAEYRTQGMGLALLKSVVGYARNNNYKIIPTCSYVRSILFSSNKYDDIVIKEVNQY